MYIPEAAHPTTVRAAVGARLRRERMLKVPGEVLVDLNQPVEPTTVVAQGERPGGVRVIDLAGVLGIAPQRVERALLVEAGQEVTAGQPLARARRFFGSREVTAPEAGTVLAVDDRGHLLLGTAAEEIELISGLRGTVANVLPRFGVVVEGSVGLIQGCWGNGGDARFGVLRLLATSGAEVLPAERIDIGARDTIIVVGASLDAQTLQNAATAQVRGIIAGGMPARLRAAAEALPFPIMLTEGFGALPIAGDLFELIMEANGREVLLDGRFQMRFGRLIPELIIPRTQATEPLPELRGLQEGQLVRVVAPPQMGATGLVSTLDAGRRRMESGIPMHGCEVTLVSGETIFVPYPNLERIG